MTSDLTARINSVRDKLTSTSKDVPWGFYQPIPFKEFDDLTPKRNTCGERWQMMIAEIPAEQWKGLRVLDLGSNLGYFSFKAAQNGASALGIEYAKESCDIAKEIASIYNVNCSFIESPIDAKLVASLDKTFDVVVCFAIFHHLYEVLGIEGAREALREVSRKGQKMFFEIGQPNEKRKRLKWKKVMSQVLGWFPKKAIIKEVLANTEFTKGKVIGYTINHKIKRWNYLFEK